MFGRAVPAFVRAVPVFGRAVFVFGRAVPPVARPVVFGEPGVDAAFAERAVVAPAFIARGVVDPVGARDVLARGVAAAAAEVTRGARFGFWPFVDADAGR